MGPSFSSLPARLYATLSLVVGLAAALGVFSLLQLTQVRQTMTEVEGHVPGVIALAAMHSGRAELRTIDTQHIAAYSTDDKATLERRMETSLDQIAAARADYEPRVRSDRERQVYRQFMTLWAAFLTERELMLALSRANRTPEARAQFTAASDGFDRASASLRELIEINREEAKVTVTRGNAIYAAARWWVLGAILAVILLAAGLGIATVSRISRALARICRDMRTGAQRLEQLSGDVAQSARTLADGATQQAAAIESAGDTLEGVASKTRGNAGQAREAARLMAESTEKVIASNEVLEGMVAAMSSIRTSSERVSRIAKAIDGIAFQTNILALNAAVEAARAGEAGHGFAVVANEVRNLAQRCAESARDTATLIEEALQSTAEGSHRVDSVVGTIQDITGNLTTVRAIVDTVSAAGEHQAAAFDQLVNGQTTVGAVTRTAAAAAQRSAEASQALRQHAVDTLVTVAALERVIGGQATAAPQSRRAAGAPRGAAPRGPSYRAEAA